jgi:hypothetical protein
LVVIHMTVVNVKHSYRPSPKARQGTVRVKITYSDPTQKLAVATF